MNPSRFARGEFEPWMIMLAVLLLVVVLCAVFVTRRRERRGDWGPGLIKVPKTSGYLPADLRGGMPQPSPVSDPQERWLLGLAAPLVEESAMLHERWSLVPYPCDDRWRRHLLAVAARNNSVRVREWRSLLARIENELRRLSPTATGEEAERAAWWVAAIAMTLRLGVAARHISGAQARKRLAAVAEPLRGRYSGWRSYGKAVIAGAERLEPGRTAGLRAATRVLTDPDGPWYLDAWEHPGQR